MQTLQINHNNGNTTIYQLIDGGKPIAYHQDTNIDVINVLERARKNKTRLRIYFGDIKTGKNWNEEYNIYGYVGLSKGNKAYFPILVNNSNSFGGSGLMDNCILKIKESKGGKILYQSKNFVPSVLEVKESNQDGYTHSVYVDGAIYSNHTTEKKAIALKNKLS